MDKYSIIIKLISDLCSNSGASQGSLIDTAVVIDRDGKPYIPAKRIKGLLLEAYLDYLDVSGDDESKADKYFGETESDASSCYVSDAIVVDSKVGDYTYYRTQTRVDDSGVAGDGSLRTIEVVKAGVSFKFTIETSMPKEELDKAIKFLRHMGTNRTRGLGEVQLLSEGKVNSSKVAKPNIGEGVSSARIYIRNDEPLLLAGSSKESESFITGTSILGYFASKYIAKYGKDEDFDNIFVNGDVKFSNGYLACSESKKTYYPIPSYYRAEKANGNSKTRVFNKLYTDAPQDEVKTKSLDGAYGYINGNELVVKKAEYSIVYHHSRNKDKMSDGEISEFYQYTPLSKGQEFSFSIAGEKKYLDKLLADLEGIRLGKARTAGYGHAEVTKVVVEKNNEENISGTKFVLECLSPLAIINDNGDYTTTIDDMKDYIEKKLGIEVNVTSYQLNPTLISGFSTLWLKQKPSFEAIDKGSYIYIETKESVSLPTSLSLGQKQNEGYGSIRVAPLGERIYTLEKAKGEEPVIVKKESELIKIVYSNAEEAYEKAFKKHSSFSNRVRSMFEESSSYDDFISRINSIKENSNKEDDKDRAKKVMEYVIKPFEGSTVPEKQYKEYFRYLFGMVQGKLKKEGK